MCSPFKIDIRPRRLPAEIRQIEESSNDHGKFTLFGNFNIFLIKLFFVICLILILRNFFLYRTPI